METKTILVTGAAGFIGFHICKALIRLDFNVIGLDNINDYYDINLKYARLHELGICKNKAKIFGEMSESHLYKGKMRFVRMNLENRTQLPMLFNENKINMVCNLAAQAGVRYSLENPEAYVDSNLNGFLNILECCRNYEIERFVYASSSSIYGDSHDVPFKESAKVDYPISLYAATKKSNELMAHTYSYLYKIETIGLRFFTVYGPWGRPDMAMFLFTDAIINNKHVNVYNNGNLSRDFTYIDDIVNGVVNTFVVNLKNSSKYKIYNIGNSSPVNLMDFIDSIEKKLGVKAKKNLMPMQPGDVTKTWADVSLLQKDYDYKPNVSINEGVSEFIDWYLLYYNLK